MLTDKEKDLVAKNFNRESPRSLSSLLELMNSARSEPLSLNEFQSLVKEIVPENIQDQRVDVLVEELGDRVDAETKAQEEADSARMMAETLSSSLSGVHRQIIDYKLVSGKTTHVVQGEVKALLTWGWQPMGGICAAAFGMSPVGGNQYCQALVKYA